MTLVPVVNLVMVIWKNVVQMWCGCKVNRGSDVVIVSLGVLQTRYSEELALMYVWQQDYDRARHYANQAMQRFLQVDLICVCVCVCLYLYMRALMNFLCILCVCVCVCVYVCTNLRVCICFICM